MQTYGGAGARAGDRLCAPTDDDLEALALRGDVGIRTSRRAV